MLVTQLSSKSTEAVRNTLGMNYLSRNFNLAFKKEKRKVKHFMMPYHGSDPSRTGVVCSNMYALQNGMQTRTGATEPFTLPFLLG
jgi:hypothetical protein